MTSKDVDPPLIGGPRDAPPPAPAAALAQAVGNMRPVRTRGRFGAFIAVLCAGVVAPIALLALRPYRLDLVALPVAWVVAAAAVWLAAFGASLVGALIPARGDVLPSAGRASRIALAAIAALAFFTLLGSVEAPGISLHPRAGAWPLVASSLGCIAISLPIAAVFLVGGALALRRVLPMGARRIGIALGAAGGAMGGFALHLHCPMASTAHVVLGHAGAVVLAALAGAIVLPALLDRHAR
jgi:hypothetical protein